MTGPTIAWLVGTLAMIFGIAGLGWQVYRMGWKAGRQYGENEEWVNQFIERGRREMLRHDRFGRFKSLKN
jgi:hypothetical protein